MKKVHPFRQELIIMKKLVYSFVEGDGKNKKLLGGKGANLCEMTQIGLNVPPGFVITTQACLDYLAEKALPEGLMAEIQEQIADLEKTTGKTFGKGLDPLLVSVRSGSALSMPGMMDTVLNLGLNEETLAGLIKQTGDERFAYDAYRRFIQLFGKVALGIDDEHFDKHFDAIKKRVGVKADVSLDASHLKEISEKFLDVVRRRSGEAVSARRYAAAAARCRSGIPFMDGQTRRRLSSRVPHYARHGQRYGRQHLHDGIRQQGRRLRDGRGLYAQPRHR